MSYRHITTAPRAYRSPMASACEHAANMVKKNKKPFTLRNYIANRKILTRHADVFTRIRFNRLKELGANRKVTVIKAFKNRFHATGIGEIQDTDFETVRLIALSEGYTHYRKEGGKTLTEL